MHVGIRWEVNSMALGCVQRVVKAWEELTSGYQEDSAQ